MVHTTAKLAVLSALLLAVSAQRYVWNGATLVFSDNKNWNGTPNQASVLNLTNDKPYVANIDVTELSVGRITFPRSGKFRFAPATGSSTRIMFKESLKESGSVVTFKGPNQNDERFHFNCHKNWLLTGTSSGTSTPPCNHNVRLDSSAAYYFSLADPALGHIYIQNLNIGDVEIETPAELPMWQFDDIRNSISLGGEECAYTIYTTGAPTCFCPTSCPESEEERQRQQAIIDEALGRNARDEEAERQRPMLVSGTYSVSHSVVGYTSAVLSVLMDDMDHFRALFASRLSAFLGSAAFSVDVTGAVMGENVVNLTIAINATRDTLLKPSAATNAQVANPFLKRIASSTLNNINSTALDKGVENSLLLVGVSMLAESLVGDGSGDSDTCETPLACEALNNASVILLSLFSEPDTLLGSICPNGLCQSSQQMAGALQAAGLWSSASIYEDDEVSALKNSIIALLSGLDLTATNNKAYFDQVMSDLGEQADALSPIVTVIPALSFAQSPNFYIGAQLSSVVLRRLINGDNRANLDASIASFIEGLGPIVDVVLTDISVVSRDRRRSEDIQLQINFNYTTHCASQDCDITESQAATSSYQLIATALHSAVVTTRITYPNCYVNLAWDHDCLISAAMEVFADSSKTDAALDVLEAYFYSFVKCDSNGFMPDGESCYALNENANSTATALAATTHAMLFPTTTISSQTTGGSGAVGASSSASGDSTGIIAGAAAGAVVLLAVLLVLLVLRRRRATPAVARTEERSVVSFENPMYDEGPKAAAGGNELYDQMGAADESLYSEPALNGNARRTTNPIYDSSENLATAGQEDGGYLEDPTVNADGGYLVQEGVHVDGDADFAEHDALEEGGGYLDVGGEGQDKQFGFE